MIHEKGFHDLNDFFVRWPQTRTVMRALAESGRLTFEERSLLQAMIFLIDCVGPSDLQS